ncbi:MAG: hypothetical protein NT108_02985 [Candidatus Kaiserbacteria bacterium]|nr:hypothetical protein [Candidatus Kaiserbacteria bacterium]
MDKQFMSRRDEDLDNMLPPVQPRADACAVTVLAPMREGSYPEWTAMLFRMSPKSSIEGLAMHLAKRGYLVTLRQVEKIVETQMSTELVGISTDGSGNFFFVKNAVGTISVGVLCRGRCDWGVSLHRFDRKILQNTAGRLLIPNANIKLFTP